MFVTVTAATSTQPSKAEPLPSLRQSQTESVEGLLGGGGGGGGGGCVTVALHSEASDWRVAPGGVAADGGLTCGVCLGETLVRVP